MNNKNLYGLGEMKGFKALSNRDYAVNEVVASLLLILIAVAAFSVIYLNFNVPEPDYKTPVKIGAEVNDEGKIVLHHEGGETITDYNVYAYYNSNNTFIGSKIVNDDFWKIGQERYPMESISNIRLIDDQIPVKIIVYNIANSNQERIFEGVLTGEVEPPTGDTVAIEDPMLITSLLTNSVEEELVCYNDTIEAPEDTVTYIYNWTVDGDPITFLLMPFDTNNLSVAKDYSGNNKNGTVNGATWVSNGKIGGAYQFSGDGDNIELPYCFDQDGYINEITIEFWIKTSIETEVIASFEGNDFWELSLYNGVIKWVTNGTDGVAEIKGDTYISNGVWHYVATSYDFSTGRCKIYIDGTEDKNQQTHDAYALIGNGDTPNGHIGISEGDQVEQTQDVLTYDDFESGMGNYHDGGRDCERRSDYSHQGSYSMRIRDNSGQESSFYHDNGIDVDSPEYTSIKIQFWWMWDDYASWGNPGWEYWEDWWVRYWDGSDWQTVLDRNYPSGFSENIWYHETIFINESEYNFPSDMKIRFECSASRDNERVFIDQIYVNASSEGTGLANFSGTIDEFRIYNRSLSAEQIYQNFLCMMDGMSDKSVIVSEETLENEIWDCIVTPNNRFQDYDTVPSESPILIISYSGGG